MVIFATLCYIRSEDKVLLQKKSKGLFGEDKYNAPGGKVQGTETLLECIIRECEEETGLRIIDPQDHGKIYHYIDGKLSFIVQLYSTRRYSGTLINNEELREGKLEWIEINKIPYHKMWEDDHFWVPKLLAGERNIEGHFYYDKDSKQLLKGHFK